MTHAVVVAVVVVAVIHVINGLFSIFLGVTSSIKAEVWLAHTVSPIWSGAFFLVTGLLGFACAKKKTAYMIMCFTAFSIVSLVTAIVSIQLLRLGLVSHTTDGNTFQKEKKDIAIILALIAAGFECLVCIISSFVSCRMARAAKKELFRQQSELFHVQVFGSKDVEIVMTKPKKTKKGKKKEKLKGSSFDEELGEPQCYPSHSAATAL